MKRTLLLFLIAVIFFNYSLTFNDNQPFLKITGIHRATADTISVDKDATICNRASAGCYSTSNYGNESLVTIVNDDTTVNLDTQSEHYGLIHFALPTSGSVNNATLKIPIWQNGVYSSEVTQWRFYIKRVTSSWSETAVTFDTRPAEDANPRYSEIIDINRDLIPVFAYQTPYTVNFNITNYINDVMGGTIANHGLIIKGIGYDSQGNAFSYGIQFKGREAGTTNAPSIVTTNPSTTPTPTLNPKSTPSGNS